ncbi:ABC transporter F family member 4-like [Diabrotica virgifera virgifera]|uniref:ABC transporter F family member 4-like n=1 Tax=Diabrotica virgifera virgifera TaxID=50390 RepID=A0A6P7G389_DIAVI|nr:ABC transporter F family member 4-like [Diabrotica virgifera virgifera]
MSSDVNANNKTKGQDLEDEDNKAASKTKSKTKSTFQDQVEEEEPDNQAPKKKTKSRTKTTTKDQSEEEEPDNETPKKKTKRKTKVKSEEEDEDQEEEKDEDEALDDDEDETDGRRKKRSVLQEEEEEADDGGNVDVEAAEDQEIKKPANSFAAKKTVAQGMMDIALITANANQLRYMVEYNQHSSTFYVNVILICLSLVLQLAIGIILIYKAWFYMQGKSKSLAAKKLNIYVTAGVFTITIINVFIASFTVTGPAPTEKEEKSR